MPKAVNGFKVCSKCHVEKPTSEFYKCASQPDGLKYSCKDCEYEKDKTRYQKNRGRYLKSPDKNKRDVKKYQAMLKAYVNKLKENGCVICGYKRCLSALEFHHTDPQFKEKAISTCTGLRQLKAEASKSIVVCANCHREIHAGLIDGETRRGIRKRNPTPTPGNGKQIIMYEQMVRPPRGGVPTPVWP
jgi:hypothetical protein